MDSKMLLSVVSARPAAIHSEADFCRRLPTRHPQMVILEFANLERLFFVLALIKLAHFKLVITGLRNPTGSIAASNYR